MFRNMGMKIDLKKKTLKITSVIEHNSDSTLSKLISKVFSHLSYEYEPKQLEKRWITTLKTNISVIFLRMSQSQQDKPMKWARASRQHIFLTD